MDRVAEVIPLPKYHRRIRFEDGTAGVTSVVEELFEPVFEPLKDISLFEQVGVDEHGAIC